MNPPEGGATLPELSAAADAAAATLTRAAAELDRLDLPASAGLAAVPGRLGELGEALHAQLSAAVAARAREAAAHAVRFADAGQVLRVVVAGYAETDAQAHRRHRDGAS
ncbi:MAG TPA: hypothetical protein VFE14_16795 [Micromonosporaceae bacterium]|nr:hypothetical protein [Micromonosporaceae bacterium]